MIGDQADFRNRLSATLPTSWFPDKVPVLNTVFDGIAAAWSSIYGMLQYVTLQTRVSTATDESLDLIAWDFFGAQVRRRPSESDGNLRARVILNLFRSRATRSAVGRVLMDLTGHPPIIFEPARTSDTGGYGAVAGQGGGIAYNAAGGWGNLNLPFQCFVVAYLPNDIGIGQIAGWGDSAGGYGVGSVEYASLDMVQGQVTEADIYSAISGVLPAATICWTTIVN